MRGGPIVAEDAMPGAGSSGLAALLAEAARLLEQDLDAARAALQRALALLEPQAPALRTLPGALTPWQARRVRDHIERGLARRLLLSELAEVTGLSAGYFSRAFKASFGEAPHAFVVRSRIRRAQRLMLATAEPLARISLDCGFADQAHLSRAFRREIGVSPHAWRRIHTTGSTATAAGP
ncbi:AraC family transcriptional regulator [Phenylobacterium sp.]|uniref:AraC family transcriptional regulator n=1 Tax=Phenylobacterium sp. TaxID=1871053 RepID=UPI00301C0A36